MAASLTVLRNDVFDKMTSQLVQAYVDKENTASLATNNSKGRLGSLAGRQAAKTFSVGPSPIATPRRALGNLSNDTTRLTGGFSNSQKKPFKSIGGSGVFKKPLGSQPRTPGLSLRNPNLATPSGQISAPKAKNKPQVLTASTNPIRPAETYPDIETMHIYQDKEPDFETLPPEDCLSSYIDRLSSLRVPPMPHPQPQRCPTDYSHMQLESNNRSSGNNTTDASLNSLEVIAPLSLDSCLDLPPLESVDFMDINSFKLWDDQIGNY